MVSRPDTKKARAKRHKRVRSKISGTASCPRLCVFRSTSNIYAQIIDDVAGVTLAQASSLDKEITGNGGNKEAAKAVGKLVAVLARDEICRRTLQKRKPGTFVGNRRNDRRGRRTRSDHDDALAP